MDPTCTERPVQHTTFVKKFIISDALVLVVGGLLSFSFIIADHRMVAAGALSFYTALCGAILFLAQLNIPFVQTYMGLFHHWCGEAVFLAVAGSFGVVAGTSYTLIFSVGLYSCTISGLCLLDHFVFVEKEEAPTPYFAEAREDTTFPWRIGTHAHFCAYVDAYYDKRRSRSFFLFLSHGL